MSEETENKPCPFCGCGKLAETWGSSDLFGDTFSVECTNCDGRVVSSVDYEDAREQWNRRHQPMFVRMENGAVVEFTASAEPMVGMPGIVPQWDDPEFLAAVAAAEDSAP